METDHDEIWNEDKIKKFETEILKIVFPHARLARTSMYGSPDIAPSSFEGALSTENIFKDTQYEYKGDGSFIHFTSLIALKSILDSGWLRMSEFGNLLDKDKNELMYAASVFQDNDLLKPQFERLDYLKDTLFCLSACEANENTKRNAFMWEVYGDKGKGVFIEYSFTKKQSYFYIFGKMQYGLDKLEPLKKVKELAEEFGKKNNFFPSNFLELLVEIQSFHKAKHFEIEDEVRLLFRKEKEPYEEHADIGIYKDMNSNQEVKYFNKLFLKGRHQFLNEGKINEFGENKILDVFPQIEIKKITLGFNISRENKFELISFFQKIKKQYCYDFEIWNIDNEERIYQMRK